MPVMYRSSSTPVRVAFLAFFLAGLVLATPRISAAQQACSFDGQLQTNPEELVESEPVQGNPEADLLVTEFFDPNCPHCQRFHTVMKKVLQEHGDQIRFFMQPVPLWAFSRAQMQAMFIAKEKGKYYEMIDAQLTSPNAGKGGMTTNQIVGLAEEIGLDPEWMRSSLQSGAKRSPVNRLTYEARQAGIQSTPTLAIGKKIVSGNSASCVGQLIEQELSAETTSRSDRDSQS